METAGGNYTHCLPPGSYTGWRQTTDYPWSVTGCAWQGNALLEANPFFEHCCYVFLYERETTLQVAFLTIIKKKLSAFSTTFNFLIATMLKFECAIGQRRYSIYFCIATVICKPFIDEFWRHFSVIWYDDGLERVGEKVTAHLMSNIKEVTEVMKADSTAFANLLQLDDTLEILTQLLLKN